MEQPRPWESTNPIRMERAIKITQAVELRQQGKTYREIAAELGVGQGTAYQYVVEAIAELALQRQQTADELIERDWAVTEILLEKALPIAAKGNDKAFEKVMALLERRAKYRGFDAPAKTETRNFHYGDRFLTKDELRAALVQKLQERRATLEHIAAAPQNAEETEDHGTTIGDTDSGLQETSDGP